MVDLNTRRCRPKGSDPADVVNALGNQNLILPGGTSKIGSLEYDVEMNGSPRKRRRTQRPADQDHEWRDHLYSRRGACA